MTFKDLSELRVDYIVREWTPDRGDSLPFKIVAIQKGVTEYGERDPSPSARDNCVRVTGRFGHGVGRIVEVHWFAVKEGSNLARQTFTFR